MTAPRVTVAVPVYNERESVPELLRRVLGTLDTLPGGPHEFLLVDDGSTDGTRDLLTEAAMRDARVRVVLLSRNFGHQAAVSAAFDHARGDAVLFMDGDLQDPPEVLPQLLGELATGPDVVYVRRERRKEPFWLRLSYFLAYRAIASLSKPALPVDAGDFALLSRRAVDAVRALPERQRYLRGLRSWVGFRQVSLPVERAARAAGRSKYGLRRLIGLALDGAFNFSTAPLRFIGLLGGAVSVGAMLFAAYAVYARIVLDRSPAGFTALAVLVAGLGGMLLLSLWIIGEYVGRIYVEVKHRPVYVVERIVGNAATGD